MANIAEVAHNRTLHTLISRCLCVHCCQGYELSGEVAWIYIQEQCYGIVSMEVPYQEALVACTYLNSTLAMLPLTSPEMNILQYMDSVLYDVPTINVNNFWISGKCKCLRCAFLIQMSKIASRPTFIPTRILFCCSPFSILIYPVSFVVESVSMHHNVSVA